ncbi:hypothetical protein [Paraburkholderia sp. RL17-381-BIF-C]|jgi:hypothetical protein|uniref:hypothetical protein n=1 Tax=Paraburkholderia sp. RL17-381-BIF-C TaxID=3031635 RepID=UPI0038BB9E15
MMLGSIPWMVEMLRKKMLPGSVGYAVAWWLRSDTFWIGTHRDELAFRSLGGLRPGARFLI